MPPKCRICNNGESNDIENYLLTCEQCNRSWHRCCHSPPIERSIVIRIVQHFFSSGEQTKLPWLCVKCARARKNAQTGRSTEPVIIDLASDPEEARHKKRIPRPSTSADPEVIVVSDDSPSTNRVLPRGGEPILILDSPERTPPRALTPVAARTSEVIVLDDSPRETITILDSPEIFPTIMHDPPPGPSSGISTAEPAHAILPVSDIEPNIDIDLPTMDVDPDVPPVSAMFQQMTVSESPAPPPRPQGGTLVPAWVRARYQASGQTAMWEQVVERQNRSSAPFSRQKPKFLKSNTREPTIVPSPFGSLGTPVTDPSTGKQLCLYEQFPKNRVPVYLSWL